jgi:hypothetical protein
MTVSTTTDVSSYRFRGLYSTTTGVTPTLQNGSSPGTEGNPNFDNQVTFEEKHSDELEVTQHPIAQGAPITDHAFKRPAQLTVKIGWSESGSANGSTLTPNDLSNIYDALLTGQANRVLYIAVTGKRIYSNMIIKSISLVTDKVTEHVLMIVLALQQVIVVGNPQQVTIVSAPPANQAVPQTTNPTTNRGTVQVQASTTGVTVP